ncbi:epoxyqueuosine reductase QueH [Lacticaseibacillus saniviri]|uniref:Epoxyqueuosine reductase QueH n=1 Tax=Lacticaseibacillus saniviri JCM 17471 = DSM 24301 TaxID=1293598 RepID=A0A0R2MR09_9LACO|nr:epoxyqueuosine reductase QueH [Lacticaseibacillus saniviri]KRO16057.1 hypothetical protein IV56_GL002056 [Lacticaseibacillus saniviri JCM 17471 = DSM 24301]MCG4281348.1 epoxyqueuosine reductase QueH [Lacticaseibacillus saniviri]
MLSEEEIKTMFEKNQKVNYDYVLQQVVAGWQAEQKRPRILLHSCCAPCSTYTLEYLTAFADVTVYYDNPNIHPRMEYERRKHVQQQFITDFNAKTGNHVTFIAADYQPSEWINAVKGLTNEPEGGARCTVCYTFRLDRVADKAKEWHFDYFASALTISPHKNAQLINELGMEIQYLYNVDYLPSDFKKRGGYKRSVEMSEEYNVYRQCYCGCLFAAKLQGVDLAQVNRDATAYYKQHRDDTFDNIAFSFTAHNTDAN